MGGGGKSSVPIYREKIEQTFKWMNIFVFDYYISTKIESNSPMAPMCSGIFDHCAHYPVWNMECGTHTRVYENAMML